MCDSPKKDTQWIAPCINLMYSSAKLLNLCDVSLEFQFLFYVELNFSHFFFHLKHRPPVLINYLNNVISYEPSRNKKRIDKIKKPNPLNQPSNLKTWQTNDTSQRDESYADQTFVNLIPFNTNSRCSCRYIILPGLLPDWQRHLELFKNNSSAMKLFWSSHPIPTVPALLILLCHDY